MHYGNTDYGVSFAGIQNLKDLCLKINMPKGYDCILRIGVLVSCQMLGISLAKKFMYSEKATKFFEIFLLLLTTIRTVKMIT